MSSNDQLIIIEKKKKFFIYHNLCVDNEWKYDRSEIPIIVKENLREAINFANNYCNKEMVEYGYDIILEEE